VNIDTANTTQTASVTIGTTAATAMSTHRHLDFYLATVLFPCVFFLGVPGWKKRTRLLLAILMTMGVAAMVACGGSSSTTVKKSQGTPAGSYTVTVTATSGSTTHTTSVNLTVQ
jgi:hypothetical protein